MTKAEIQKLCKEIGITCTGDGLLMNSITTENWAAAWADCRSSMCRRQLELQGLEKILNILKEMKQNER